MLDRTNHRFYGLCSQLRIPGGCLRQAWTDVRTVFVVALILDAIYQVAVHVGIFTLELAVTATFLALVPHVISRGGCDADRAVGGGREGNRLPCWRMTNSNVGQTTLSPERLTIMSSAPKQDWTKPAAMAIPKGGFNKETAEQGRYGPIFPKTPACYGFSIVAKIIPGREDLFYEHARTIEKAVVGQPDVLAVLKLHYLRWLLFPIKGETYFMYQGIFDTDFDKYTEDAVAIFSASGLVTVFENLEGFPVDWKTNASAFVKFVREHQCPSFLEYGEYPYVSADEIKKGAEAQGCVQRNARPDAVTSEQPPKTQSELAK